MTELIVIHGISLPPGEYGGQEIEALFTNTLDADAHPYFAKSSGLEVSAHFLVRRAGEVVQFVQRMRGLGTRVSPAGRGASSAMTSALVSNSKAVMTRRTPMLSTTP